MADKSLFFGSERPSADEPSGLRGFQSGVHLVRLGRDGRLHEPVGATFHDDQCRGHKA